MSENYDEARDGPLLFGDVPTGRKLDTGSAPNGMGTLSRFPPATPDRVEVARRNIREVILDRTTDPWTDVETGVEYELIRGHLDVINPEACGATAFEVTGDGWIVGLRPAGIPPEVKRVHFGTLTSGRSA